MSCFIKTCNGSYRLSVPEGLITDEKDHNHDSMTSTEVRLLLFKEDVIRDSTTSRKTKNDIICTASLILDEAER